jgi:hypothetical protein
MCKKYDRNGDGKINKHELRVVLAELHIRLEGDQLERLMGEFDHYHTGALSYEYNPSSLLSSYSLLTWYVLFFNHNSEFSAMAFNPATETHVIHEPVSQQGHGGAADSRVVEGKHLDGTPGSGHHDPTGIDSGGGHRQLLFGGSHHQHQSEKELCKTDEATKVAASKDLYSACFAEAEILLQCKLCGTHVFYLPFTSTRHRPPSSPFCGGMYRFDQQRLMHMHVYVKD